MVRLQAKLAGKIYETNDYSKFELTSFNRDVKKIKPLMNSFKKHGWLSAYPMHCVMSNGKLKIKAGHHRFKAAQELGIPVKYVVLNDEMDIFEGEEATTHWTLQDFLTAYVHEGRIDYKEVDAYQKLTGFPLSFCINALSNNTRTGGNLSKKFKTGLFKVRTKKVAYEFAKYAIACRESGFTNYKESNFLNALSMCIRVQGFDADRFVSRMQNYPEMHEKKHTLNDYLEFIETIYNYKTKVDHRMPVRFFAEQTMAKRDPSRQGKSNGGN